MTDHPLPPPDGPDRADPDAELASAHLDEETTPEEQARVEADPALTAAVERFRTVAEQVRDVPPPPTGLLDQQVGAALADLDAADDGARDDGAPADGVVPLRGRRTGGTPWWQRLPLGAVAAAVVVVALVSAIGLASLAGDDDTDADTATAALDTDDSGDAGADGDSTTESMELDEAPDDGAALGPSAGSADGSAERAAFDSYDALADQLDDELARTGEDATASDATASDDAATDDAASDDAATEERSDGESIDPAAGTDPCDAVGQLDLEPTTVITVRSVLVAGTPVTAVVHTDAGERRLMVVDDATCGVVLDRTL